MRRDHGRPRSRRWPAWTIPVRGAPLQMIVTEPTAPTLTRLVAYAGRHLTLKQMISGAFMIGGGWTAGLDEQKLSRALRASIEGNLWIASRARAGARTCTPSASGPA